MSVTFPQKQAYDFNCDAVAFPALSDSNKIRCLISREALQDHFGVRDEDLTAPFQANRSAIENKAWSLISAGRFEDDHTIRIGSSDFP